MEVEVSYGSRLSLRARATATSTLPFHQRFDTLLLDTDNGEISLGPCVLLPERQAHGCHGRLVFDTEVYSFETLFDEGKVRNVERALNNLPLVLAHHRSLQPEFKAFVADWMYELNIRRWFFEHLDGELYDEPPEVRAAALGTILRGEGRRFMSSFSDRLAQLEDATLEFTRAEHEKHAFHLRKQAWHLIQEAPFLKRTNLKPRGYAGDSEMMRMLYMNRWEGDSIFGKLLHKHAIESEAAQAVRNRRRFIHASVCEHAEALRAHRCPIRIMSVACGPAAELQDLFSAPDRFPCYDITLLDQDVQALTEAATGIAQAEARHGKRAHITYVNESVRTLLRTTELEKQWGRFHFIYTMGLFDYLTEPVAKAVATKLFHLLHPGGELVVGNFHRCNPTRTYMSYWMDWVLYYRTEEEMHALVHGIPGARSSVEFEESGSQMFLRVRRA